MPFSICFSRAARCSLSILTAASNSFFQELVACPRKILLLQVGQAEVEVDKSKRGISLGGRLKFRQRGIVLLEVQVILANKKAVFG